MLCRHPSSSPTTTGTEQVHSDPTPCAMITKRLYLPGSDWWVSDSGNRPRVLSHWLRSGGFLDLVIPDPACTRTCHLPSSSIVQLNEMLLATLIGPDIFSYSATLLKRALNSDLKWPQISGKFRHKSCGWFFVFPRYALHFPGFFARHPVGFLV